MRDTPALNRRARGAITLAVIAVLVSPVAFDRDSFPLSTYPMYSSSRGSESTLVTAQGVTADGSTRELSPTLIGDSDDPLVVVGRLRAALSAGRGDVRCTEIAERVEARTSYVDVVVIEIVSERHDTVARTLGEDSLVEREVRSSCEVSRT
ncbi:MAG: hypothetical protein ABJH68_20655 [Ilumatobacter sp.]|uniref:hypothetical protein n=1 Tax=Ilumatobacter sp. TaxID=1967498 RepID=UPI003297BA33